MPRAARRPRRSISSGPGWAGFRRPSPIHPRCAPVLRRCSEDTSRAATLRYGSGAKQSWGLNLSRGIRRKGEDAQWSAIPRQFNIYRLSRAGTLENIEVPTQRLATVTPEEIRQRYREFREFTYFDEV